MIGPRKGSKAHIMAKNRIHNRLRVLDSDFRRNDDHWVYSDFW